MRMSDVTSPKYGTLATSTPPIHVIRKPHPRPIFPNSCTLHPPLHTSPHQPWQCKIDACVYWPVTRLHLESCHALGGTVVCPDCHRILIDLFPCRHYAYLGNYQSFNLASSDFQRSRSGYASTRTCSLRSAEALLTP